MLEKRSLVGATILVACLHVSEALTYRWNTRVNTSAAGEITVNDPRCPFGNLYYLHERRGADHQSGVGVIMTCAQKPICGKVPMCLYSTKPFCANSFEYLSGVEVQGDSKSHLEYCCQTDTVLNDKAQEKCETVIVSDRSIYRNGSSASSRVKKSAPDVRVAAAKLRTVVQLKEKLTTSDQIIKSIKPTSQGLEVVLCTIECKNNTASGGPAPAAAAANAAAAASETQILDTGAQNPSEESHPVEGSPESAGGGGGIGNFPINLKHCFPSDAVVITFNGPTKMKDLQDNDHVQVSGGLFEPVEFFMHKDPWTTIQYVKISLTDGQTLSLSKRHLLPMTNCNDLSNLTSLYNEKSVFAFRARPDQCVAVALNSVWQLARITNVEIVMQQGLYSPITRSGTLVVNGVLTSCYSYVENHALLYSIFKRYFIYRDLFLAYFDWTSVEPSNGLPLLARVASWMSPMLSGLRS